MPNLTPREHITAVIDLLSDKDRWTTGYLARDFNGHILDDPNNNRATCWCVEGAFCKVAGLRGSDVMRYRTAAWLALEEVKRDPIGVNDNDGYGAVMKMLYEARDLIIKQETPPPA